MQVRFLSLLVILFGMAACNVANFGSSNGSKKGEFNATGEKPTKDAKKNPDDKDGKTSGDDGNDDGNDDKDDPKVTDGDIKVPGGKEEEDLTALTIKSIEHDDDTTLVFETLNGKTLNIAFPAEGKTIKVPGVCNVDKPTTLKMKAISEDGQTRALSEAQCFLGKRVDAKSVYIGFEDDCNSLKASKIDEEIGLYSCPKSSLEVPGLRMDDSIDIDDWD